MVITWLLIGAILGWGVSSYIAGVISKKASASSLMFWGSILALPLILIPIFMGASFSPEPMLIIWSGASVLALFVTWIFYWLALQRGDSSPVIAIGSTYPLVSLLIFVIIDISSPGLYLIAAILCIAFGVFLISRNDGQNVRIDTKTIMLALGAVVAWGIWGVFDWAALQYGSPFDLMLWSSLFYLLVPVIVGIWSIFTASSLAISRDVAAGRFTFIFLSQLAALAFYFALEKAGDNPEIIIALTATYPAVTMLLTVLRGEEKITLLRSAGLSAIILGVAAVQVYPG